MKDAVDLPFTDFEIHFRQYFESQAYRYSILTKDPGAVNQACDHLLTK